MTLNLSIPGQGHEDLKPRITVFGVGGAGGNAVNNMIEKQLDGVDFVVANTDAQALQQSRSDNRVQLGVKLTEGLGAGARASVGAAAAEESIEHIVDHLAGAHMCFITAGMGGGTGTGAAPIIAQAARELGVLTVGVVTKPFQFEGAKRMRQAEEGVETLQRVVDTLIIIPNQNLFRLANEKTTFTEAFSMADDVLYQGVKGVTDLMVRPGQINLDFADVRAVMDEMGKAMMGTGEAEGEDRAIQAAERAIANPLLDEISLRGAKGVLINITGSHDLTLFELDEAANRIREEVDAEANIIVGSTLDPEMEGLMRVSVVATGIDVTEEHGDIPVPRRSLSAPLAKTVSAEETQQAQEAAAPAPEANTVSESQNAEPSLFETTQEEAKPAPSQGYVRPPAAPKAPIAADVEAGDLPPPAYKPRVEAFAPKPDALEETQDRFTAPTAPSAKAPPAAALNRLRSAVERVPAARAAAEPQEQATTSQADDADRPRFGINSLINRMTGQGAEGEPAAERPTPGAPAKPTAPQPHVRASQDEARGDQEKIEIPAFLRRQAN